jgi:hypothetical protein
MPRTKRRACVVARHSNIVRVDFTREPDPPAPRFPGAAGVRKSQLETAGQSAVAVASMRLARGQAG